MNDALSLLTALPSMECDTLPGSSVSQALVTWGSLSISQPEVASPYEGYLFPPAWQALANVPAINTQGWQSHAHRAIPMGVWCPSALLLLTHEGGKLGVDIDPTPSGEWLVWWETPTLVARLASSWQALALLIEQGPKALVDTCRRPWESPSTLEAFPPLEQPGLQTWAAQQPGPGQAWGLCQAGQALEKDSLVARHPRHPLFWTTR